MSCSFPTVISTFVLVSLSIVASAGCAQGLESPLPELDYAVASGGSATTTGSTTSSGAGGTGGAAAASGTTSSSSSSGLPSSSSSTSTSGSSSSSTGSVGMGCDSSNDCGTCGDCALVGACAPAMSACQVDQNCNALLGCLQACTDPTCANTCATQYSAGQQAYMTVMTCIMCTSCPVSCAAMSQGLCSP